MENNKVEIHQELINEVYDKWRKEECKGMGRLEVIEKFFTPKHRAAVQLGNMNYQVCNGGWSQWHYNGYSEDLEDLIGYAETGVELGLKTFIPILEILSSIKDLGEPSDYDDTEEHTCNACDGTGETEEYNEDTEEYENIECEECYGNGSYEEDVRGEEVYCELLEEYDNKYYQIDEDEFFKDCEKFLESFDNEEKAI